MLKLRRLFLTFTLLSFTSSLAAADSARLKVGLILPLTGPGALWGHHLRQGAEMATRGEERVQLIFEDDHLDAAAAVTAYRKLRDEDGICHFIVFGAQAATSVAPLAEQDECLLLTITSDPKPVLGKRFAVRIGIEASDQAARLADYLRKKNVRRIAILSTTHDSMLEMAKSLGQLASPSGMEVVFESDFPKGETDFRSIIAKLQRLKPDAVINSLLPPSLSSFAKQSRGPLAAIQQLGFSQSENLDEISAAAGALEGFVFSRVVLSPQFQESYFREFQEPPQSYAGYAFDLIRILSTLQQRHLDTPQQMSSALQSVAEFYRNGACGELAFDRSNSLRTQSELCEIRNGAVRCPAR